MRKLFLDKELSDVQLVCGDTVFHCHVTLLSARSAVFRAMFHTDMAEKKERKARIDGFSPEIIREMLVSFLLRPRAPSPPAPVLRLSGREVGSLGSAAPS